MIASAAALTAANVNRFHDVISKLLLKFIIRVAPPHSRVYKKRSGRRALSRRAAAAFVQPLG
jgi:hypothetical protein